MRSAKDLIKVAMNSILAMIITFIKAPALLIIYGITFVVFGSVILPVTVTQFTITYITLLIYDVDFVGKIEV